MGRTVIDIKTGQERKLTDILQLNAYFPMDSKLGDFDEKKHSYSNPATGERLPSVTEIIGIISEYRRDAVGVNAMNRGSYIHKCCEMYDRNELDLDRLDSIDSPYIVAWINFKCDYDKKINFNSGRMEVSMKHSKHLYSGTIDRIYESKTDEIYNVYLSKEGKYKVRKRHIRKSDFNDFLCLKRAFELKLKNIGG